jgi:UDP-galactopyranose mutase
MFSNDPYVHEMYERLLGDNVHWQDREAWIYSHDVFTRYPFQGALYGLPPEIIKECLLGAIEARYGITESAAKNEGATSAASASNGTARNGHSNGNGTVPVALNRASRNGAASQCGTSSGASGSNGAIKRLEDCCGDGILESTARLAPAKTNGHANADALPHANGNGKTPSAEPANFEEFIYNVWGRGIAKHFAIPYNRKLWAVPLTEMETSWLGGRVPMPDLGEMIDGALRPVPKPMGPNARFGYPLRGGFQALMDGFMPYVADRLRLNSRVAKISPSQKLVTLTTGEKLRYESLISTMPLPVLIRSMGDEAPAEVQSAAAALRNVSVRCVHIGVGREKLTEKHWIYYPEQTVFHRIFVQGNASPHCNPDGGFGLTCEITYSPHKPLPCDGDELVQRCIDDCIQVGIISADDPIWATAQCDLPYAYVVYDHARPKNIATIRKWLDAQDIHLAGRYSEWEYYNSDHAFLAGRKVAERVRSVSPLKSQPA